MALKYKLVQKRNLGKDQDENPEKVYAQMVSGDLVTFEELIEEVGDSTVAGSAGVKAVLDRLNVVLARHLRNGRRVNVGELGTFRLNFGSQGVIGSDDFNTGLIREPRVRFLPGKAHHEKPYKFRTNRTGNGRTGLRRRRGRETGRTLELTIDN